VALSRLVVIQTAYLGDMVMTTPLLRELRRVRPGAPICVLTTPLGAEVLRHHPVVDEVVAYDKRRPPFGLPGLLAAIRSLRRGHEDVVAIAAQRSHRTGLVLRATSATRRIGFQGAAGAWSYTDRVAYRAGVHAVDRYLDLAVPLGGEPHRADRRPHLAVTSAERDRARALLRGLGIAPERPLACIAPGSHWPTKRWSAEGFGEIGRRLVADGHAVVVVGTEPERDLCERVANVTGPGAVAAAGRLGVREFVATLARSTLTVANDSGPAHVAAAFGAAVVSVFGPTSPESGLVPFGDHVRVVQHPDLVCRPCSRHGPRSCPLGHFRCMREIGPDDVWRAVQDLRERGGARRQVVLPG